MGEKPDADRVLLAVRRLEHALVDEPRHIRSWAWAQHAEDIRIVVDAFKKVAADGA